MKDESGTKELCPECGQDRFSWERFWASQKECERLRIALDGYKATVERLENQILAYQERETEQR